MQDGNGEMTKSMERVLAYLDKNKEGVPQTIAGELNLAPRTVSFALSRLISQGLVKKIPNLKDMRQPIYVRGSDTRNYNLPEKKPDANKIEIPQWSIEEILKDIITQEDLTFLAEFI